MKPDRIEKACTIAQRGGIQYNPQMGVYFVPSLSSGREYMVSASGLCNCASMAICYHAIAAFGAHVPALQFRWADDLETLAMTAAVHRTAIEQMPERVKAFCRAEYKAARQRLQPEYVSREVKRKGERVIVASRVEAAQYHDGIQII